LIYKYKKNKTFIMHEGRYITSDHGIGLILNLVSYFNSQLQPRVLASGYN